MNLTFSPVLADQLQTLQTLVHTTFREAYQAKTSAEDLEAHLSLYHSREKLSEELNDPQVHYFFVLQHHTLAGFIMLRQQSTHPQLGNAPATQLQRIYLLPEFWGKGLAKPMMDFCEDFARREGSAWLWLQVWQQNPRAIRFYQKCGFEHFGFMDFQFAHTLHSDWVMRKAL